MRLQILHEDDALLFVDKPPDIVVQRAHDPDEPVLYEIARAYTSPLFLLQRLDRGTSGVMFFSKLAKVNANLTRQFERKQIRKRYLALCDGPLTVAQTIDAPLRRTGAITFGVGAGGKRALTHVEPIEVGPSASLLSIVLATGRTHQIRVHLAAIGHPLAGDWLYGERSAARPMLHAAELEMTHPLSGERLRVAAPLPPDFREEAARRGIDVRPGGRNVSA